MEVSAMGGKLYLEISTLKECGKYTVMCICKEELYGNCNYTYTLV